MVEACREALSGTSYRRIILICPDNGQRIVRADDVIRSLSGDGADRVLVSLEEMAYQSSEEMLPGLGDLIDGTAVYAEILSKDPVLACHRMKPGSRALDDADMETVAFHTAIMALDAAYDQIFIECGRFFEDERVLQNLCLTEPSLAVILAPDSALEIASELTNYLGELGFADTLFFTLDGSVQTGNPAQSKVQDYFSDHDLKEAWG